MNTNHDDYIALLRKLRKLKGVKKVFVRSGLRYDYVLADNNKDFVRELCEFHVSGQLKVAPEHVSKRVTNMMGKAGKEEFLTFKSWFEEANKKLGKKQYLVPYFMSSHPGCALEDAIELAEFLRDHHMYPEQVQDFIPTPGSLSTCMYYTGINPLDGKTVYVAKKGRDKAKQRALMQFKNIENYDLVKEALIEANRRDLIGFGPECLIPPRPIGRNSNRTSQSNGARTSQASDRRNGRNLSEQRSRGNTRSKADGSRRTSHSKSNARGSSNGQSSVSKGRPSRSGMTKGHSTNTSRGGR